METSDAVTTLAALAQSTRLAIFRLLVKAGPGGRPAGEIGLTLDVPAATLSFHLKDLSRARLIVGRPEGRHIYYAVDFERIGHLLAFLTEDCCGGNPCLAAASAQRTPDPVPVHDSGTKEHPR
ncbi:MAG: winged helix-turn-helix transcriptional regulator [Proteobacteria bacterium]|nr:winged helix-turn-helix transcriptional regulator [Burkholderiales bacterium]